MDKIDKTRNFGVKIIGNSPWLALIFGIICLLGFCLTQLEYQIIAVYTIFGIIMSPLVIQLYKTGKQMYAMLYGGLIGLFYGVTVNVFSVDLTIFEVLYLVSCTFLGIGLVFTILRKYLIRYIKDD